MSGLYNWVTSAATPSEEASTPNAPEGEAATPPPAPQDSDAVRRSTRACVLDKNALQLPAREPRRVSPQERLRIRAGKATPSPSPTTSASGQFDFPTPTPIMDADAIRALVQETLRASTAAAVQAATMTVSETLPDAVRTTMREQVRDVSALTRKPDLPTFDTLNIETWIRRIENAFTRANIDNVKDKFAFLESKIGANSDPKINEFLCTNPPTEATWTAFLTYLRKRYGPTKRQQIQSLITGTEFDGMQPSSVCALMREKAGAVTVDDIIKEQIYRRLPIDLQRQLAQEAESMTASELAEMADAFYDKDGRPLHAASNKTVNAIGGGDSNSFNPNASASNRPSNTGAFTSAFEDDSSDVNAIRARQAQKQRHNNNNRPQSSVNNNNNNNRPSNKTLINSDGICGYHGKFGNDAQRCASGCKHWSKFQSKNAQASGQRRM